jgi:hypothetical protein
MKPTRLSGLLSALTIFGFVACSDRGAPTQPTVPLALAGHWSGTVTSQEGSGGPVALCASESIGADVTQDGASVNGRLAASCLGTLDLTSKIDGDVLTGTLSGRSSAFTGGRVTAAVSSSRIQMTVGRSGKGGFIPVLSIELFR